MTRSVTATVAVAVMAVFVVVAEGAVVAPVVGRDPPGEVLRGVAPAGRGSGVGGDGSGGGGQIVQEAKLVADDGTPGDQFGYSVSLSGDRALIGALYYDDAHDPTSGSAYVFKWDDATGWVQEAKFVADDGTEYGCFGGSVSLSGDRALIGAYGDDDNGSKSGSAYVFKWDDATGWVQEAKLVADDGAEWDDFGRSVSLSGDRALIGAEYDDDNGSVPGSAYVFKWDDATGWAQEAKLVADDGAEGGDFGSSVSLSGERALIGAYGDYNGSGSGSAYVFKWDDATGWLQEVKLVADDGARFNYFGFSVSLSGDRALIGAYGDDDNGPASGSAYVFKWDDATGWAQEAKLAVDDGSGSDYFGTSVSLSGDRALVGASGDDYNGSGSAYVFKLDDATGWVQEAMLVADDGISASLFGWSVSLSGNWALAGARSSYVAVPGSVYVFSLGDDSTGDDDDSTGDDDGSFGDDDDDDGGLGECELYDSSKDAGICADIIDYSVFVKAGTNQTAMGASIQAQAGDLASAQALFPDCYDDGLVLACIGTYPKCNDLIGLPHRPCKGLCEHVNEVCNVVFQVTCLKQGLPADDCFTDCGEADDLGLDLFPEESTAYPGAPIELECFNPLDAMGDDDDDDDDEIPAPTPSPVSYGPPAVFERRSSYGPPAVFERRCRLTFEYRTEPRADVLVYTGQVPASGELGSSVSQGSCSVQLDLVVGGTHVFTANGAGRAAVESTFPSAVCDNMRIQVLDTATCLISPVQALEVV